MNYCYRREMRHNYLVVDPGSLETAGYEVYMLERNLIRGLLKFHVSRPEGRVCFYYEITSRQPLSRMLESRSLGISGLRRLIMGISEVLEQLEVFLLPEEQLLLDPDYIYADPETQQIYLCLVPGSRQDFPMAIGSLLQYLLGYVDHQDKECVVLAYSLYQESQKENFGIRDLLNIVSGEVTEHVKKEDKKGKSGKVESGYEEYHGDMLMEDQSKVRYGTKPLAPRSSGTPGSSRSKKTDLKSGWKRIFGQAAEQILGRPDTGKQDSRMEEETPWESWRDLLEEPEAAPAVSETEREPMTTLLVDLTAASGSYCLRSLQPGLADIPVDSFPFIIGKNSSLADYQLEKETVSRLHVKISQNESGFQITDLNSTNGTKVRGRLLGNNETEVLFPGDEVQIAEWKYHFEQI